MKTNNIKRKFVTYEDSLMEIRKRYLSKKAKYDRFVDHVSSYDNIIQLDIPRDCILIPEVRGHLNTTLKYPMAEYLWYKSKSRKVDIMKAFGPIWAQMVDSDGNIQSNYGYQIDRVLQRDFGEKDTWRKAAEFLYVNKEININILDETTIASDYDVPCNNLFKITWNQRNSQVKVQVVARSLDLIFGYPYDCFFAQLLGYRFINELKKIEDNNYWLREIQYVPINAHLYLKDMIPEKIESWNLRTEKFIKVDPKILDDNKVSEEACEKYDSVDEYKDVRKKLISEYGRGIMTAKQRLTNLNQRQPRFEDLDIQTFKLNLDELDPGYVDDLKASLTYSKNRCYYDEDRLRKFLDSSLDTDRKVAIYIPEIETNKNGIIYLNRDMETMPYPNDLIVNIVKWKKNRF